MPNISSNALALSLATVLLGGCTDSGSPTQKAGGNQTAPDEATADTRATRVDSINGIPGHHFGESLDAFPGLVPIGQKELGAQSYYYAKGGEPGWFGKRTKEYSNEFYTRYTFAEGKFVSFFASGRGDMRQALQRQAEYLYGPGAPTNNGSLWEGRQAEAWTAPDNRGFGPANTLLVRSKAFASQQAQAQADQLKRENAQ
jgi:hypothetical protein